MRKPTAARNLATSTAYSDERYAHPFFLPAAPKERDAFKGQNNLASLNKQQVGPIPPVKNQGKIALDDIIGSTGVKEIEDLGEIRFHALGDTGVGNAEGAQEVADDMTTDFKAGSGATNPAFLLHLGDVLYGNDKAHHYGERFYSPYRRYPGKIIAIPGNHDGEVRDPKDSPALSAFQDNFCASSATVPPQASATGIFRKTMTLPGVYWCLEAPFIRIVGLYSNSVENPGFLEGKGSGGKFDMSQITWLSDTLSDIAKANKADPKALAIAVHHPPFSAAGHSGSTEMSGTVDQACSKAGLLPDVVFSAHAHNYQRYTRRMQGRQIPYFVVGTGGIGVQGVPDATGAPIEGNVDTTYDAAIKSHGYLFVAVSKTQMKFEFWQQGNQHTKPFDPFTVSLVHHTVL
jgi:calcineurin-like phosphoesterase family protein